MKFTTSIILLAATALAAPLLDNRGAGRATVAQTAQNIVDTVKNATSPIVPVSTKTGGGSFTIPTVGDVNIPAVPSIGNIVNSVSEQVANATTAATTKTPSTSGSSISVLKGYLASFIGSGSGFHV